MNKKTLAWVIGLVVGGLLIGALTVHASSSFWESVAQATGVALGDNLSRQITPPSTDTLSQEMSLGASTYTSKSIAQTSITSNSVVVASLLNNSGADRVIRELDFFAVGSGNTATTTISFGYSTVSSTIVGTLYTDTFTTSTYQWFADSSHTGAERIWQNGAYLNVIVNSAVTTTQGFFAADYYKF